MEASQVTQDEIETHLETQEYQVFLLLLLSGLTTIFIAFLDAVVTKCLTGGKNLQERFIWAHGFKG